MFNLYKHDMHRARKPSKLWYKEAKKIESSVSTMLGPNGMYKMTESGEVLTSGKDVLDNIELGPMAEPITESVNAQYREFGDGTTSLALLLSRLISKANELSGEGVPMPTIISGYRKAMDAAISAVGRESRKMERKNIESVIKHSVAGSPADEDAIVSVIRDSILFLKEPDEDDITVLTEQGGEGSEVIVGLKLDYNRIRDDMPEKMYDVKVALLDKVAPRKTSLDMKISITSREAYRAASEMERNQMKDFVGRLEEIGVGAVFSEGEIDARAAEMMAKRGIMGFEKVKEDDMKEISEATGAQKINMMSLSENDLGFVGILDDSQEEGCIGGVCVT